MTELAPDWRISGTFSCSRTEATIQASGLSWRTVSVASTLESSRSVVMMTWSASATPACRSTWRRVASPMMTVRPSSWASCLAAGLGSTMTMESLLCPLLTSVSTAERPLVPYPTTTTRCPMLLLHRAIRNNSRPCEASTSRVVPISSTRKAMRAGVMRKALTNRAASDTGAMSP